MKFNSLRVKLIGAVVGCLALAALTIIGILHVNFAQQTAQMSVNAVSEARQVFLDQEAADINKLSVVLASILANGSFRQPYTEANRQVIYEQAKPLFEQMRDKYHFTLWQFHSTEDLGTVFLRMHNPQRRGDPLNRWMYNQTVKTKTLTTGKELGRAGFALRAMMPNFDSAGKLLGYVEVGEEIGSFFETMKRQTGNEYALVLKKELLQRERWADGRKTVGLEDNWDNSASVVAGDATTADPKLVSLDLTIDSLAAEGQVIGEVASQGKTYVRGIFPLTTADDQRAGAVIVAKDMTEALSTIRSLELKIAALVLVVTVAICWLMTFILNRWLFRRLDRMIETATMVVGGDYQREIKKSADDEVGEFEYLFDQFRRVFLSLIEEKESVSRH